MALHREYRNCTLDDGTIRGEVRYVDDSVASLAGWMTFRASPDLGRIEAAIDRDPGLLRSLWALVDAYGEPGTVPVEDYDWSGIRDSSAEARAAMVRLVDQVITEAEYLDMLGIVSPERQIVDRFVEAARGLAQVPTSVLCDAYRAARRRFHDSAGEDLAVSCQHAQDAASIAAVLFQRDDDGDGDASTFITKEMASL